MKWSKIRDLYVSATGQSAAAVNEAFIHLSEANRQVCGKLHVQELEETDTEAATTVGQDYIAKPDDFDSVMTLVNVETGEKLNAEMDGMRGRMNYCEPETGKPAQGPPQWWVVSNNRIYLRPTPDEMYTLKVLGRVHGTEVTRDMLEQEPVVSPEYHMAFVYAAAASFLRLHPDVSQALGQGQVLAALETQADTILVDKVLPKQEENLDKRGRFALRFRLGGRS